MNDTELVAHQTTDNKLVFSGIITLFKQNSELHSNTIDELIAWILTAPQLSLENVGLKFYLKSGPIRSSMQLNLLLKNSNDRHQLSGRLGFFTRKIF